MMDPVPPAASAHLDEALRQHAAEGTLDPASAQRVEEHVRVCEACADDIERLRSFMAHGRIQESRRAHNMEPQLEALWPAIEARIEQRKIATLPFVSPASSPAASRPATAWSSWLGRSAWIIGAAAAIVGAVAITARIGHSPRSVGADSSALVDQRMMIQATDSARVYEQETRDLLDRLELERSMLRPSAVTAIDRDLRVVDSAIAEVKAAIERDPNNPALRRLLAESYRHKLDVLRRVGNAG